MQNNLTVSMMLIYVICIAWALVLAKFAKSSFSDELSNTTRNSSMDGIRGFAAVSVFIHHSVYSYNLYLNQKWGVPEGVSQAVGKYLLHLGSFSVSLFFMITAYLFWQVILLKRRDMDWTGFYIKRIYRIVPLYTFIVLMVFFIFSLYYEEKGYSSFASSLVSWLGFGFFPLQSVNGYPSSWSIVAGVFWTLAIEWKFYLALPLLAIFAKSERSSSVSLFLSAAGLVLLHKLDIMSHKQLAIASCFVLGAVAAHINVYHSRISSRISPMAATIIAIVAFVYSIYEHGWMYKLKAEILTFIFFILVVEFGALKFLFSSMVLRFLGVISYSIYLCHGLVLTIINGFVFGDEGYFIRSASALLIVIGLSTILYLYIERPFILIGKGKPISESFSRKVAN